MPSGCDTKPSPAARMHPALPRTPPGPLPLLAPFTCRLTRTQPPPTLQRRYGLAGLCWPPGRGVHCAGLDGGGRGGGQRGGLPGKRLLRPMFLPAVCGTRLCSPTLSSWGCAASPARRHAAVQRSCRKARICARCGGAVHLRSNPKLRLRCLALQILINAFLARGQDGKVGAGAY